jgi:hypothetical protein
MLVSLLKIELLSTSEAFDSGEFYDGTHQIFAALFIRTHPLSASTDDPKNRSQRHELSDDYASHSQAQRA